MKTGTSPKSLWPICYVLITVLLLISNDLIPDSEAQDSRYSLVMKSVKTIAELQTQEYPNGEFASLAKNRAQPELPETQTANVSILGDWEGTCTLSGDKPRYSVPTKTTIKLRLTLANGNITGYVIIGANTRNIINGGWDSSILKLETQPSEIVGDEDSMTLKGALQNDKLVGTIKGISKAKMIPDIVTIGRWEATRKSSKLEVSSPKPTISASELGLWESIENSKNPKDFKAYLEKYPNGQFKALAILWEEAAREEEQRDATMVFFVVHRHYSGVRSHHNCGGGCGGNLCIRTNSIQFKTANGFRCMHDFEISCAQIKEVRDIESYMEGHFSLKIKDGDKYEFGAFRDKSEVLDAIRSACGLQVK